MSIVRWEPFGEIDSMFNRLMPSILSRLPMRAVASNGDNFEWPPPRISVRRTRSI
jgi:hypothetical protein